MRMRGSPFIGAIASLLVALSVLAACSQGERDSSTVPTPSRAQAGGDSNVSQQSTPSKAQPGSESNVSQQPTSSSAQQVLPLWITHISENTLAMRSPAFRCGEGYCAGTVVFGLGRSLGEDSFELKVEPVPEQKYLQLVITFDPRKLTAEVVIDATVAILERKPDPLYPGHVKVIY